MNISLLETVVKWYNQFLVTLRGLKLHWITSLGISLNLSKPLIHFRSPWLKLVKVGGSQESFKFLGLWHNTSLNCDMPREKNIGKLSSYHSLCMLATARKVAERIIDMSINKIADSYLSDRQYGFRRRVSTLDAINLVVNTAGEAISGKR